MVWVNREHDLRNSKQLYYSLNIYQGMKKTLLLLSALLMTSMQVFADDFKARMLEMAPFMSVSENGKYGIFSINGIMLCIVDLNDPNSANMFMDDRGYDAFQNEYLPGYGTSVAADGTAVGNAVLYELTSETTYSMTDNAVVYTGDGLKILPSPRPDLYNMAHAITPDGSVICGNVGNDEFGIDSKKIMVVPAVWYRNASGEYDRYELLPHPETDFLGGIPQYVTAIAISADGNTVAGTVTATSGFWTYPIVYKRDAATGKWSYTLPAQELFHTHPEVTVPENPGDYPGKQDYISEESRTAYENALAEWNAAGGSDWSTYPYIDDYMTEEENAAYEAACVAYEEAKAAYDAAVDAATAGSVTMTFNNVVLSPDGKLYSSTYTPSNGWIAMIKGEGKNARLISPKYSRILNAGKGNRVARETTAGEEYTTATSFVFNLEDGSYKTYTGQEGVNVTCAANDGIFLGYSGDVYTPTAVVIDPRKGVCKMQDYYQESCPEMAAWINANMVHEVEAYDWELDTYTGKEMVISGIPYCTPDMKTVVSYAYNTFDYNTDAYYFGYVFQGLPGIGAGTDGIASAVKDADKDVQYFTIDGRRVGAPAKGLNIIRTADGATKKVFLK